MRTSSSSIMSDKSAELSVSTSGFSPLTLGVIHLTVYLLT